VDRRRGFASRGSSGRARIFVLLCALASGCGPSLVPIPTIKDIPHTCTRLVTGILVDDPGWGPALREPGGVDQFDVLWPNGFAGIQESNGVAIVDQNRAVVARMGDLIRAMGDVVGPGTVHVICGDVEVLPR
jgi:hypothetical protein